MDQKKKKKNEDKGPKFESLKIDRWFGKYKNLDQEPVEAVRKLGEPWYVQGFATLITLVIEVNVDLIEVCLKPCFFPWYLSNWEYPFFVLNEHLENHSLERENENSQDSGLRDPCSIISETQKLSFKMSYSPVLHPILLFKPGTRMLFWKP